MDTFISNSVAETIAFARDWARQLLPNDVVGLVGDLGAGKTHFVRGLLEGLESVEDATSPTFTLVHEYRSGRLPVFHFDFYRLNQPAELAGIGFDDYLEEGGIAVIEWADRFAAVLPQRTRWIRLEIGADASTRTITDETK
ncbi:MAG: tRNA (adenosine(37)-N6)-threonylcarbamoyltransferase complex ATPase subunit type 1 TsaE [Verrucomicrobiota bacterium]|nr:tRNA (adenosine(37)-N6)-threonylcarbamoyltransferase complex ATPase subunit type 1 TsaE [Verrucomicrobiota bacterium]